MANFYAKYHLFSSFFVRKLRHYMLEKFKILDICQPFNLSLSERKSKKILYFILCKCIITIQKCIPECRFFYNCIVKCVHHVNLNKSISFGHVGQNVFKFLEHDFSMFGFKYQSWTDTNGTITTTSDQHSR